jgi:hypothetical protein
MGVQSVPRNVADLRMMARPSFERPRRWERFLLARPRRALGRSLAAWCLVARFVSWLRRFLPQGHKLLGPKQVYASGKAPAPLNSGDLLPRSGRTRQRWQRCSAASPRRRRNLASTWGHSPGRPPTTSDECRLGRATRNVERRFTAPERRRPCHWPARRCCPLLPAVPPSERHRALRWR